MIYLSGVKGDTYPISRRLPPSAGRFAGWDWSRYFEIMHALAARPYNTETYLQAVYAFQSLPADMVFSDAISTAAWARYAELYQTRGRDLVLSYMLRLPRMTGRYNPTDQRTWYDVEKEWQRSEGAALQGNLAGLADVDHLDPLGYEPLPPPPPVAHRPTPIPRPPPVYRPPPVQPPPPPGLPPPQATPDSVLRAQIDRIIAEHVARGTQSQIEGSLTPEQIRYLDRAQPGWREHLGRMFPEPTTPQERMEDQIWRTEPTNLRRRIDAVLEWQRTPDYLMPRYSIPPRAMPRSRFESIVTSVWEAVRPQITWEAVGVALRNRGFYPPGEGVPELYVPHIYEDPPVRRGIEAFLMGRRWYGRMYPLSTPAGLGPRTIPHFEQLVRVAYEAALGYNASEYHSQYSFTAQDVRDALIRRGLLPEAPTPEPPQPEPPQPEPPAPYSPDVSERAALREAFQQVLSNWQGRYYAQVRATKGSIPDWTALRNALYTAARAIVRARGERFISTNDVLWALRKRNYTPVGEAPPAEWRPVAPPVVHPPAPPPVHHGRPLAYDRMDEAPPMRMGIDGSLRHWYGRNIPYVADRITTLPNYENLINKSYLLGQSFNRTRYQGRYEFTRADVRNAVELRGYRPRGWTPAAPPPGILPPTPPPVVPPPPPPHLPGLPPVVNYDSRVEPPPVRWAVDRELRMRGGNRFPPVAERVTTLPRFSTAVGNAYSAARRHNTYRYYIRKYQFARGDVENAFRGRGYRPEPAPRLGQQIDSEPPTVAGLSTGYYVTVM